MSTTSKIEWTEKTWNPVRGCSVISPGCVNCYAMKQAHRFSGEGKPYEGLTKLTKAGPQWTGQIRTVEDALLEPLSWREPKRVFVNSMSDLFHEDVPDEFIDRVFAVMALTPRHTFQILTKRAERMREYFAPKDHHGSLRERAINVSIWSLLGTPRGSKIDHGGNWRCAWPLPNVWLGVSVESPPYLKRIDELLATQAAIHFVSLEPLLADLGDISRFLTAGDSDNPQGSEHSRIDGDVPAARVAALQRQRPRRDKSIGHERGDQEAERPAVRKALDWVIVGGESGAGARPCALEWIEGIVVQCRAASVPVFVKQVGSRPYDHDRPEAGGGPLYAVRDRKGGDPAEWPADLRVREFPEVRG